MSRYIDIKSAEIVIKRHIGLCGPFTRQDALDALWSIPEANVREVVYAYWEKVPLKKYPDEVKFQCSNCGYPALAEYNYCPTCGAVMNKGE